MNDVQARSGRISHFDRDYPLLAALRHDRPHAIRDFEHVLELSQRFRREVVEPEALAI